VLRAADDDSLRLYDVANGALLKTLFAKTYGASKVCFTHTPTCILAASGVRRAGGTSEHDVRYHSFHDNTYLRFFKVRVASAPASQHRKRNPSALLPLVQLSRLPAAHLQAR
jgi:hypothetical protein